MATSCRYEFQAKHFGFTDATPDLFHQIQWTKNRWVFLGYRFFMAAYCIAWFLYAYIDVRNDNFYQLLSNWTEGVMNVYFLWAFFVSIYAVVTRKRYFEQTLGKLRWFHIVNWLLFCVAADAVFQISIFYWALIAPGRTAEQNLRPVTFHIHATNSILLLIDIFMVAFPTRLLHFIYTVLYGVLYAVALLVFHFTGLNSQVYSVIDFANSPGIAAAYVVVSVVIFPTILHSVVFGFYHLRAFIARNTVLKDSSTSRPAGNLEMGTFNQAFEDTSPSTHHNGTLKS
ncbi:unnamed protein product [Clavelina lepadiformis]|uniref:Protein rolling stone n=1 Tax=Clavelina lepadiformis TaxID=159417 RepID=A0ABP0GDA5_CLALP